MFRFLYLYCHISCVSVYVLWEMRIYYWRTLPMCWKQLSVDSGWYWGIVSVAGYQIYLRHNQNLDMAKDGSWTGAASFLSGHHKNWSRRWESDLVLNRQLDPRQVHKNSGAKPLEAGQNEGEGYSHRRTRHRRQCLGSPYSGEPIHRSLIWIPAPVECSFANISSGWNRGHITIWKLTASQVYSVKSAYNVLFLGSIDFAGHKPIWKAWVPSKCKFFI